MAYNSTTGSQMSGDIRYENDPEDTQIDFENDSITLRAGGANNMVISTTSITASVLLSSSMPISASSFWVDGVQVSGGGGTPGGSTTQVQYNSGGSFAGSNNFTFDGKDVKIGGVTGSLIVTGSIIASSIGAGIFTTDISGSGNASFSGFELYSAGARLAYVSGSGQISASSGITASAFYGSGASLTGLPSAAITTYNSTTNNYILSAVNATTVQGEANLQFDGTTLSVTGDMSGSGVLSVDQIKCSGSVTAVSFAGNGSALTGLPSAAIATYSTSGDNRIITSVDATTVQGEANLTFDGTTLAVAGASSRFLVTGSAEIMRGLSVGMNTPSATGAGDGIYTTDISGSGKATFRGFELYGAGVKYAHITGSGQISASSGITGSALYTEHTVIDAIHVSSSLPVSASSFWVDGVQITGGGGGGTPGGADGQVQYNNGGSFGGEAELVYDDSNNRLGVGTAVPTHTLSVTGSAAISGDLTVSGSLRSAKRIEMTTHYFQYGGTAETFIPFGYGNTDDATNPTEKNQFIAPYPGSLKKLMVRTHNTQNGHATASLWVGNDGTEDFNVGGSVVEHVTASMASANTTYTFNFTGTSHFTSSQIVGVSFDFRLNPGEVNMTCVWEYDDREL